MSAESSGRSAAPRRRSALVLAAGFMAITLYRMTASKPFQGVPWLGSQDDLLLHALAFGALTLPLLFLMSERYAVLLAGTLALLIEALQALVPGREPALTDLLAGCVGIALALGGAQIARRVRAGRGQGG